MIRRYQNGTPVRHLLNTLEAQDPYAAAAQNAQSAQTALNNEQRRVLNVRNNVIPAAQNLHQRQQDILNEITPEHERANDYYNQMQDLSDREFWNTPRGWFGGEQINAQQKLREMQRSSEFPQMLRNVLPNNGMYNVSQVDSGYDTDRQVYCTPYGCLPYQQAGATDVPTVISNPRFQAGARNGSLPFRKINAAERQPGDISLIVGSAPVEYSNPLGPRTVRAHHTTIYAGDNNPGSADPQSINAYSAHHGTAMDFKMAEHDREDRPFEFYRYVGQTPRMERNLGYANDVAQAIGPNPGESSRPSMVAPEALASLPPQQFANPYARSLDISMPELNYGNTFTNLPDQTKTFSGSKFGTGKDVVMNRFGGTRKYVNKGIKRK